MYSGELYLRSPRRSYESLIVHAVTALANQVVDGVFVVVVQAEIDVSVRVLVDAHVTRPFAVVDLHPGEFDVQVETANDRNCASNDEHVANCHVDSLDFLVDGLGKSFGLPYI